MKILDEVEEESQEEEDIYDDIAKRIATVEYYYNVKIMGNYPIMKRFNQYEHLGDLFEIDAIRMGLKKKT